MKGKGFENSQILNRGDRILHSRILAFSIPRFPDTQILHIFIFYGKEMESGVKCR